MKRFAAILAALFSISTAQAGVITIDFESAPQAPFITTNIEIGGFRFSPNCHFDIVLTVLGARVCGLVSIPLAAVLRRAVTRIFWDLPYP